MGQIGSRTYAFIGLEPQDGIGDLAPEGIVFVNAEQSPSGKPLLLVGNEVSGTATVWQIDEIKE